MTGSLDLPWSDPRLRIPHAEPGNRIGLFGGSFNPPHSGHRLVAEVALKRLGLNQVWWMVTPGNPLKDHANLAPLSERLDHVARFADHPAMRVTALEARFPTSYSARTIDRLIRLRPRLSFVWIMGADNLAGFHRWQDWRDIMQRLPVAIVDRPGATLSPLSAPAAHAFAAARVDEACAASLASRPPPAWTFLHTPLDSTSSTALRDRPGRENPRRSATMP
ncbi:nicotinate-nucleotide adenylyltransferase [Stappia indica]|uniref:nicotinate-nucleotide adenylyltransferase n=1 Tax=Stappia indica TaxID=538381 RepID=UPI001CD3171F|nr:nicotinate-nucleotide adenylyltransferase [Stappia indica]MCA1299815.1 nicotinate-nucleotide adenylyltransferase [Stappia indica]